MEWSRVFCSRKSFFLLLCLLVINGMAFYHYLQNNQDEFIAGKNEYQQYISHYTEKIDAVLMNKEWLEEFSVFSDMDSFAWKNIEKTAHDYSKLESIKPIALPNQEIGAVFTYKLIHYLIFAFGVWLILLFTAEKKSSMELLLHTYKNGRTKLFFTRLLILFTGMAAIVLLLYFEIFLILIAESGIPSLNAPVQSLFMMGDVTLPCTILQGLLISLFIQGIGCFLSVLVLWFILYRIKSIGIGICLYFILLGLEYIAYTNINIQSNLCFFRYANIYFSIHPSELLCKYVNVRVGNFPIGSDTIYLCFCLLLITILCFLLFIFSKYFYPIRTQSRVEKMIKKLLSLLRRKTAYLPVVFWELYKLLWCQKGIWIMLLFLWILIGTIDNTQMFFSAKQEYLNAFYDANSGPITENTMKELEQDVRMQETLEFVKGQLAKGQKNLWLVNSRGYEVLLGTKGDSRRNKDAVIAFLCLLLLISGIIIYEKKREMMPLLRCGCRAPNWLLHRKHMAADIIVLAIWTITILTEWKRIAIHYKLNCLSAPVQSLPFLSEITLPISISLYIVWIALAELILFYSFKNFIVFLSAICRKTYFVILFGLLFLIPNVLSGTLIIKDVFTNTDFYFRCMEVFVLLIISAVLNKLTQVKWNQVKRR